jgi:hypothetical protein
LPARAEAADAAVVLTVSIAVTAPVPVIGAGWLTEQTGGSTEPAGPATVHERATLPVKPPLGVTVMVELPVAPGEAMVTVVLVRVKFGATGLAVTVTGIFVVSVMPPEVPVTAIVYEPAVVAACVLTVRVAATADVPMIVVCAGTVQVGGSTAPVGPVIAHESATFPVKPPLGVTLMVEVPVVPGDLMLTAVPLNAKAGVPGRPVTVTRTLVVTALPPEAPVTVIVYELTVVAACVVTVSMAVSARTPVMVACGLMEQVGAPVPPGGPALTEH